MIVVCARERRGEREVGGAVSRELGWVLRKMEGAEALEGGEGLGWFKWQMGVGTD